MYSDLPLPNLAFTLVIRSLNKSPVNVIFILDLLYALSVALPCSRYSLHFCVTLPAGDESFCISDTTISATPFRISGSRKALVTLNLSLVCICLRFVIFSFAIILLALYLITLKQLLIPLKMFLIVLSLRLLSSLLIMIMCLVYQLSYLLSRCLSS